MKPAAAPTDTLGTVRSYSDLHEIMRNRADELEITRDALDELAGLQTGYSGKVLAPRPIRRIIPRSNDLVLGLMLPALGMKLIAVVDEEALERIKNRRVKRKLPSVLGTTIHLQFSRKELKKRQRNGGNNRRENLTPKRRSEISRNAALARWRKQKEFKDAKARNEESRAALGLQVATSTPDTQRVRLRSSTRRAGL